MKGFIFMPAATLLVVAGIWAALLGRSPGPSVDVSDPHAEAAYPDPSRRERLRAAAQPMAGRVGETVGGYLGTPGSRSQALLLSAAMHAVFVLHCLPVFVPALLGAVALGLFRREAARTLVKFSSPTFAFAAKKIFLAALLALGVFALTPMAVPYWSAYAALGVMTATLAIYVENIPVKI